MLFVVLVGCVSFSAGAVRRARAGQLCLDRPGLVMLGVPAAARHSQTFSGVLVAAFIVL